MIFCQSKRLIIRDVEKEDSEVITEWKNLQLFRKMSIGYDSEVTYENQKRDIERSKESKQLYFIIEMIAQSKAIGYIRINWMDGENKIGWLRFGLGEERSKGYCKEALKASIRRLFEIGVKRIDAEVYEFNIVSYELLKAIGFLHEGTRRKAHFLEDNYYDIYTMGLLQSDFED